MKLRTLIAALLALTAYCLLAPNLLSAPDKRKIAAAKQQLRDRAVAQASHGDVPTEFPESNNLCLLCHSNLKRDEIVEKHSGEGILCAHCHGISYEHMDDETSHTRPDYVFGRGQVAPLCQKCHVGGCEKPEKMAAFLAKWKYKTRPNGRVILKGAVCTDCHGTHVMVGAPMVGDQDEKDDDD